jgi:hypothetical protein
MVPLGYYTLRELERLCILEAEAGTNDATSWRSRDLIVQILVSMMRMGKLPLFVERNGTVYRVPEEDVLLLYDYLPEAVWTGYLPNEPTEEDIEEEAEDRKDGITQAYYSEIALLLENNPEIKVYCGARLLVSAADAASMRSQKLPIQKTGAPGRPSSMHLVLAENARKDEAGEIAPTCAARARELEAWLKTTHPEAPPLRWKSIRNVLLKNRRSPGNGSSLN